MTEGTEWMELLELGSYPELGGEDTTPFTLFGALWFPSGAWAWRGACGA